MHVWCDEKAEKVAGWHVEVQQILSGEGWTFSSREALAMFLNQLTGGDDNESQRWEHIIGV
jgi:hypothetical protein